MFLQWTHDCILPVQDRHWWKPFSYQSRMIDWWRRNILQDTKNEPSYNPSSNLSLHYYVMFWMILIFSGFSIVRFVDLSLWLQYRVMLTVLKCLFVMEHTAHTCEGQLKDWLPFVCAQSFTSLQKCGRFKVVFLIKSHNKTICFVTFQQKLANLSVVAHAIASHLEKWTSRSIPKEYNILETAYLYSLGTIAQQYFTVAWQNSQQHCHLL